MIRKKQCQAKSVAATPTATKPSSHQENVLTLMLVASAANLMLAVIAHLRLQKTETAQGRAAMMTIAISKPRVAASKAKKNPAAEQRNITITKNTTVQVVATTSTTTATLHTKNQPAAKITITNPAAQKLLLQHQHMAVIMVPVAVAKQRPKSHAVRRLHVRKKILNYLLTTRLATIKSSVVATSNTLRSTITTITTITTVLKSNR